MDFFVGVDIGTTGAKALLIDNKGKVITTCTAEYPLYHPRPNWAEQNPSDWWEGTVKAIRQLLTDSRIPPAQIRALGLSGQMHSAVFLDRDYSALRPAILWCDTRTTPQCKWIFDRIGKEGLLRLVSNRPLEGFTAPKILWVRDQEPKIYEKIHKVLLPKDYVRFKLSGELLTEESDAAGTLMFDLKKRQWSKEFLDLIDVPVSFLPECRKSPDVCGKISGEASEFTGLPKGIPIAGGGADNSCGAIGTGIVKPGRILASIGTSGVILAPTDSLKVDPDMRVQSFCHSVPGKWYLMGCMLSAGGAFRWYRDVFGQAEIDISRNMGVDPYELLLEEARKAPIGSEGLLFMPYLIGERTPHMDAKAKGAFLGISLRHEKRHFVRALIEGVTFGLRDSLEIINRLGEEIQQIRLTGGGARSLFWAQVQADIYQREVILTDNQEGPAFGAAILAAVCGGLYGDVIEASESMVKIRDSIPPNKDSARIYDSFFEVYEKLYPSLKNRYAEISDLLK
jgi:xylulokinase